MLKKTIDQFCSEIPDLESIEPKNEDIVEASDDERLPICQKAIKFPVDDFTKEYF